MVIQELLSQNIKGIKSIKIKPENGKNVIIISGKNGAGKSSILDSIIYALAGKKQIPEKALRKGETEGKVQIDLGDLMVTRTFTSKDSYLKVETKEGAAFGKAQDKLNELIEMNSFDPLEFSNMDKKQQREKLLEVLGVNVDDLELKKKNLTDERYEIGVKGKQLKGEFEGIEKPEGEQKEIDIEKLSNDIGLLNKMLSGDEENDRDIENARGTIEYLDKEIKEIKSKLENLEEHRKQKQKELEDLCGHSIQDEKKKKMEAELKENNDKLHSVNEINKKAEQGKRYKELEQKVKEERDNYDKKTDEIKKVEEEKKQRLEKAKMPIKDLSIDEEGVTFGKIPYEQLSTSEQIRVGMAIAMASNPELRIVLIKDASLIDADGLKIVSDMCKQKGEDYQVWLERVAQFDKKGKPIKDGVYIEEGEIK